MVKLLLMSALVAYMVFISHTEGSSYSSASARAYFKIGNTSPCNPTKKPKCTKPNEVYVENPSTCPPQTCKSINKIYHCPLARNNTNTGNSYGTCKCKPGYYRNSINECISKENCLKCTGPHEYFSCGVACDRTCRSLWKPYQTTCRIATVGCVPKCYCEPGYARDDKNICIPIKYCGGFCHGDPNAVPGCGVNCGRRCSDIGNKKIVCSAICNRNGCDCKPGYVFDGNKGRCVLPKECSPTCGINEVFSNCTNGGCGPKTCDGLGMKIGCVKMNPKSCIEGCLCKNGYLRNKDGLCIPKRECPECGGDPNAISGCGVNCGQHCSDIGQGSKLCLKICYNDACDCRKGFFYDDNIGKCVRPKDCTPTCGKNEVFSECINGGCTAKHCSQLGRPVPCVKPKICYNGCLCKDGYLRADNGTCIPMDECPQPECEDDEIYSSCPEKSCMPLTCSQLGFPLNCTTNSESECPGEPRCICANENVRDNEGNCIPKDQCPSCGGDPNAVSGCSNYCNNRCSDYKIKNKFCTLICSLNGCACRDGFVYDDNLKKCVNPRDCTPTCGINEVFDTCANGGCRKWNCSLATACKKPVKCKAGCSCQDGYSRAANGTCISQDQCPVSCTKPNEVYDSCPPVCPPQTCESIGKIYSCPMIPVNNTDHCSGACRCIKGYYRNENEECISEENCLKCTGPNEYFACGGACDNVCETLSERNQTNCPIRNIKCNPMCYCREGYARDKNNICIPIKNCPEPECEDDETYDTCPENSCMPLTCSQLGFPLNCTVNSESGCPGKPGCICANENVRDNEGNCIPKDQCPSCGGDPNAVSGCSNYCGNRCSDYKIKTRFCPLFCLLNGCACRDGLVYDDNLKKCVNPRDCTPTCGINEVFDTCVNGGCRKWNCSLATACKKPVKCKAGCSCQDGYSRAANGTCIPQDQCPVNCTGPNEYFACGGACDNVCETLSEQNQTNCPIRNIKCNPMCYCREGYARDKNNICIPIKNCPAKIPCDGEEISSPHLIQKCVRETTNGKYTENITAEEGNLYLKSCANHLDLVETVGSTLGEASCPIMDSNSCGPNERYEERPSLVCDPLECSELGFPIDCPPVENTDCDDEPGCICDDGYVRNHLGICVLKSQCPSCGGDPNAVAGCGVNCGKTCSTYGKDEACIDICYSNACDCKDGFVYDDVVKKCVKYENCSKTSSDCDVDITDSKNRYYRGSIALSGEFIYQLCQSQPNQNFVTSATSIMVPLAQIALFAQKVVLKQLLTLLNLNCIDEIRNVYSEETQSYTNQEHVEFELATKYYINEDYTLDENFISESQKYFDAGGENINFAQNEQAADTINEWVADKTRNRIQDLVSADSLDANTVMVLVNAIYFLGNWVHQFNPNNTRKRDFTKRNKDIIQLDTMYQENTFKYAEASFQGVDIQALEMPYKNNNFSFLVILPELGCFDDAVLALRNPDNFIDIIERLSNQKVQVYLPKLNVATTIDEAEMLKKVNVTAMFNPASDGFKGILENDQPLYISSAIQKAFIKVDEMGTEAAAATAIAIGLTAVLEPPKIFVFSADRPYLFYILFNGVPLFCGAYMGT